MIGRTSTSYHDSIGHAHYVTGVLYRDIKEPGYVTREKKLRELVPRSSYFPFAIPKDSREVRFFVFLKKSVCLYQTEQCTRSCFRFFYFKEDVI